MNLDWANLADHYKDAARYMPEWKLAHTSMARLCEYIGSTQSKGRLYGHKSHHQLRISQISAEYPLHPTIPLLTIEPINSDKIEFRYRDTNIKARQWSRIVEAEQTIDRFKKAHAQLGWSSINLP